MQTSLAPRPRSLGQPGILSDLRALPAILRREWRIFTRYPSWMIALFIWPLIFPMMYILTAPRAFRPRWKRTGSLYAKNRCK